MTLRNRLFWIHYYVTGVLRGYPGYTTEYLIRRVLHILTYRRNGQWWTGV